MEMQLTSSRCIGVTGMYIIKVEILATGYWPCCSKMRATKAVPSFFRKTRVGQMITIPLRDGVGAWEVAEVDGEEGGLGPPT